MTTVISVRGRDRKALLADPDFVYVGRRCWGWRHSIFANPYKVPRDARTPQACVEMFRFLVLGKAGTQAERVVGRAIRDGLGSLRGKTLGCWCGDWRPGEPEIACHAVCLAKLADAPPVTGAGAAGIAAGGAKAKEGGE
jgi:hypothetical protein